MSKVVIYARVSTDDKQDYERQITELKRRVKEKHEPPTEIEIISEKISGYKLNNGSKLENLLDTIRNNPTEYDILYVWELSRLGRNPLETRNRIEFLLQNGVKIYVETLGTTLGNENEGISGAITKMLLLLLLEFSHIEAETTKMRIKSGLLQSARNGKVGGGNHIPYGFKKDDEKNLVICEIESAVIRRIFELYNDGSGIRRISTILNNDHVPTRYNKIYKDRIIKFSTRKKEGRYIKWSDKQIHDILKNTIYKGERRFKGELLKVEAIIKPELFDLCNIILKSKNTKTDVKHIYLLKTILKCSCGRNYLGINKDDEKVYKCESRLHTKGSCGSFGINIALIESTIFHLILSSSHLINFLKSSKQIRNEIEKERDILVSEITSLEKDIKLLKKKQSILLDDYLEKGFDKDLLQEKTTSINRDIKKVADRILTKSKERDIKNSLLKKEFETNYDIIFNSKKDRNSLRSVIGEIINRITVVESHKDYKIIEVEIDVLDRSTVKFRLKLFNSLLKFKEKKYIYLIESVLLKTLHNGLDVNIELNRNEFITLRKSFDTNFNSELPIKYDSENIKTEDFIYRTIVDTSHVLPMLKVRFINMYSKFFISPIELREEQMIFI